MFYTYYADTLITLMLGWIRGFTDWIWNLISMGDGSAGRSFLAWFSDHWILLVLVMILAGIVADWLVWLIRWRPYWLWFGKKRRILDDTDEEPVRERGANTIAPENTVRRPQSPHFTSKALPRGEIAHPEEDFEEDDLFDVVSSAIPETKPQTQSVRVGVSVNQYIENKPRANAQADREQTKTDEIEWFE